VIIRILFIEEFAIFGFLSIERVLLTNTVILVEWTLYLLLRVFDEGSNFILVIIRV
jgi:hypothetical protein